MSRASRLAGTLVSIGVLAASCTSGSGSPGAGTSTPTSTTAVSTDVGAVADSYSIPDGTPFGHFGLQHMEWLAYCATEFGFETTLDTRPGQRPTVFIPPMPFEQLPRWEEVNQACTAEAVSRGWVKPLPSTPEQLREEYQRLLAVNECLTELGYGTDPPSEERFLEERIWEVYANTPLGGAQVVVAPMAGDNLPADVVQQLAVQEACPLWPTE